MFKQKLATFSTLFIYSIFAFSAAQTSIKEESLDQLLSLSGMEKVVQELPESFSEGVAEGLKAEGISNKVAIVDSVNETIFANEILDQIKFQIRKSVTEKEAQSLLTWYRSDLGMRITEAEDQDSSEEQMAKVMSAAPELMADRKRVEFAQRLDESLALTDRVMEIQESVMLSTFMGATAIVKPEQTMTLEQFKAQISPMMDQMKPQIRQMVQLMSLDAYKSFAMEELLKYELFLAQVHSMKFYSATMKGLNLGLSRATQDWAKNLAQKADDFQKAGQ